MRPNPSSRKRPALSSSVQPSITSFFSGSSGATANGAAASRRPVLPAAVQSGLLSVGMRVRKAVPEGYKSGTYAHGKYTPTEKGISPYGTPELSSNQRSDSSTASIPAPGSAMKRGFPDTDEDEFQLPVSGTASIFEPKNRLIAAPGSRRRSFHIAVGRPEKDVAMAETDDFEEASFLKPVEETEYS